MFLDRDGTLIEEVGYLDRLDRLELFPYTVDAVRILNRAGFAVVVISNQSGVARGLLTEAFVDQAHAHLASVLETGDARIDAFYYCPHHPEGTIEGYRRQCECRKPGTGMLTRAVADLGIDLSQSFLVGDRWDDIAAGRSAGTRAVLVRTGYGASAADSPRAGLSADFVANDLAGALSWILLR